MALAAVRGGHSRVGEQRLAKTGVTRAHLAHQRVAVAPVILRAGHGGSGPYTAYCAHS